MSLNLIQTTNLDYNFGSFKALDKVSLNVPKSSIYCFLGPNGAGKTTTIRTLLGLYNIPQNKVKIFGKDIQKSRIEILKNIGSLVETPSLYEHLSAYENLNILRHYIGGDKKRISKVLEIVDLNRAVKKKVKAMSLGMKQRLALAIALFNKPKLLVLDEPTNGLDPQGIREIRELLIKLNKENGITIFLSSHILSEVEKLATHVGVINKGKLVFEGTLNELKRASQNRVFVKVSSPERAKTVLSSNGFDPQIIDDNYISLVNDENESLNLPLKKLIDNDVEIISVKSEGENLEDLFFELTEDKQ